MTKYHNWKQFSKVLEKLGYNLVSQQFQGVLYFHHKELDHKLPIEKNNQMSTEYVQRTLEVIGLPYEYFVSLIKRCK